METILIRKRAVNLSENRRKLKAKTTGADWFRDVGRATLPIFVIGLALLPYPVLAQENGQKTIGIGEADLFTSIRLSAFSSDNAFRVSENAVESSGFRIAPSATLAANRRGLKLTARYDGDFAGYTEGELDYNDHQIVGSVDAILGTRKRFSAYADLTSRHEELGTGLTRGSANVGDEQVRAVDVTVDANYIYGAPTARFNLGGGLFVKNVAFQNRSDITEGNDYSEVRPYGRFSYRLSKDTRALIEVGLSGFDFDNDLRDRSAVEVLAGLTFQGTGKTRGQLKLGVASNDYSVNEVEDSVVFVADIGLVFSPSTNSRIEVNFNREINNEEGIDFTAAGTQTIDDTALIRWNKKWSGFSRSVAYIELENQNRDCPLFGTQSSEFGIEFSVLPRRWIEIGAGISSRNVTADSCGDTVGNDLEYDLEELVAFVRIFP